MGNKRILVVEDDVDNQGLIRYILERAGFEVLTANNGLEGIAAALKEQPELILMDMAMPEMDGWTATEKLKGDPLTQTIPVVALTVRTLPEDRIRATQAGCDGYITKPMHLSEFISQVESFLPKK